MSGSHLLHTCFIPTAPSSLRRRLPRKAHLIQSKVREIFMPALSSTMTEGKIVSLAAIIVDEGLSALLAETQSQKTSCSGSTPYSNHAPKVLEETPNPVAAVSVSNNVSRSMVECLADALNALYKKILGKGDRSSSSLTLTKVEEVYIGEDDREVEGASFLVPTALALCLSLAPVEVAQASQELRGNAIYEVGELFELGIQLSYLLLLLALLGVGSFYVIRQVLVRRELDLSAKELQEQVRSGDASATELFDLGAVMLRRKIYPAATKYLLQAIQKWDGDDQDLAQVYNALGVTYTRDGKIEKGIAQFEMAVKLQPGYVTAWNNLGDAYEKINDMKSALKAFEEALLFDPNNKVARPRRDAMKAKVDMYRGVPVSVKPKKK